jgi:hypothetical protein
MTPTPTEPEPLPEDARPAALRRRNQILAIGAIVVAALVPLAMAFGFDVCSPLDAVGVHLDACEPEALPPAPAPAAPSPGDPGDAGAR